MYPIVSTPLLTPAKLAEPLSITADGLKPVQLPSYVAVVTSNRELELAYRSNNISVILFKRDGVELLFALDEIRQYFSEPRIRLKRTNLTPRQMSVVLKESLNGCGLTETLPKESRILQKDMLAIATQNLKLNRRKRGVVLMANASAPNQPNTETGWGDYPHVDLAMPSSIGYSICGSQFYFEEDIVSLHPNKSHAGSTAYLVKENANPIIIPPLWVAYFKPFKNISRGLENGLEMANLGGVHQRPQPDNSIFPYVPHQRLYFGVASTPLFRT
ncbi:MAG: hypothetical protein R3A13_02400 [Bdellovibrionota bacterium]